MPEPMIEICDLCYKYIATGPRWILEDLNLCIEPGEYLLVCGASGSGKSTLCRAFNGLIPHFYGGVLEGHVWVAGLDTRTHPVSELFVHVGMVFQNPEAQLFNSTVERELAFGLESLGLPRSEIGRRVVETAEIMGLTPLLECNPHQLSGGEKQLVAIAATLTLRPQVIVLDEPYANLDPVNVGRVRAALREINQRGTAIVLTEHRLQNAVADADRMAVLHQGQVVLDGSPRAVLREEITEFGLNPPPVVRVARKLGLPEVPLSVKELSAVADELVLPSDLLPACPIYGPSDSRLVLQVEDITFSFDGTPVLKNVRLELRAGECLAVVGANGSGKTTLIKHFNGLYQPARGRVVVLGQDTRRAKVSQLARHVGLAFQNANHQFFQFQVRDEIEVGARALGCYDQAWLRELIDLFRLEPLLERSPYRLSEGEKKRVAFAAALAARPEILVLDEPTTGQDWLFRQRLGEMLAELRARGQTVVLVTHDLEFAAQHACRWVLLAEGQVLADGDPWEVMGDGAAMRRADLEPTQAFQLARLAYETSALLVSNVKRENVKRNSGSPRMILNLDPRTKLALTALYALLITMSGRPTWLLAELSLLMLAILAVGEGRQYLSWLRLVAVMTASWFAISVLAFDLFVAVMASLRLVALTSTFFLFFRTTAPEDLGNALVQAGLPYVFAFVLSTSLQFVPVISRKTQHIFDAQRSRGIPLEPGLAALRYYPALMAPLLIQAFQLADELAEAMESRGFGRPHRTFAVAYRLRWWDYGLLLLAVAGLVAAGYWGR